MPQSGENPTHTIPVSYMGTVRVAVFVGVRVVLKGTVGRFELEVALRRRWR